ncbi:MAG: SBBP repeat-containing protein [Bacteroidia bacterium]|nr:SBBP repeat-containing protein [Bacteroidia bacterium]
MKNNLTFLICKVLLLLICTSTFADNGANPFGNFKNVASSAQIETDPALKQKVNQWMDQSKVLGFQENKGQIIGDDGKPADFVLYKAEAPNLNIWVTNTGLTYQFFKLEEDEEEERERKQKKGNIDKSEGEKDAKTNWYRVDMVLKGANIKKENIITEGNITQGEVNYYLGHCPNGIFNAKTFTKVIIKEVYKGIDWVIYTSKEGGIKHDFIVHPQADPNQIKLIYEGNGKFNVKNNQILFENKLGKVIEGNLLCYQGSESNVIQSNYAVKENEYSMYLGAGNLSAEPSNLKKTKKGVFSYEVSVELNEYNKNETLIIDPQLTWSTFFGSNNADGTYDIKLDPSGNIYLVGYTSSTTFPLQNLGGAYNQITSTGWEGVILRFNSSMALTWSTYYGGSGMDELRSVAIDPSGNIYLAGMTSSTNFPLQNLAGAYNQATLNGSSDAVILCFTNTGVRTWATYYGGNAADWGNSIALDASGNILVTGHTQSNVFPTQNWAGAYNQAVYGGGTGDVFILRFTNAGVRVWATYYGGNGITSQEQGNSITCDPAGNIYVAGLASSANFPILNWAGAYNQSILGNTAGDAFILRFTNAGVRTWATFYGANAGVSTAHCVKIDPVGNIYVVGSTAASNFPTQVLFGAYNQTVFGGSSDAYILKFTSSGVRTWATFYGGNGAESISLNGAGGNNLAFDNCGNVYMSFRTYSTNNFTLGNSSCGFYNPSLSGASDLFLVKFNSLNSVIWATYFGGSSNDWREPLTTDNAGNLFFSGEWNASSASPLANPGGGAYYDATANGSDEIFISKFIPVPPTYTQTQVNPTACACNGVATISVTCGEAPYNYYWSNAVSVLNTTLTTHSISGLCPGVYQVTVTSNCNYTYTTTYTLIGTASTLTANITTFNASCTNPTGSVTINSVTNGVPNYTIAEGTTTLAANVNVPYTISGATVGTHTYIITSSNGCSTTFTAIILPGGTMPNISIAPTATLTCLTNSLIVTGTSTTSGVSYSWSPQNVSTNTAVATSAGNYTLVVTNTVSGCSSSSVIAVTQNTTVPNISASISGTLTCLTTSVILTGTSTTSGVTYSWQPQNVNTNTAVATVAGNYTFFVIDPSNGCASTSVVAVTQNITPPNFTALSSNNLNCLLSTATLTASGTGIVFVWNGGALSNAANPAVVSVVGSYSVTATNSSNGCASSSVITVTQNTTTPGVSASVSGTLSCSASSATLTGSSITSGATYSWLPQNVNTNTAVATSPGNYTCIVTDPLNGCMNSTIVTLNSVPMFTANISVLNQINCFGNNNGVVQINNSGGNPPFSITNLNNSNNINNIFSFPVNLGGLSAANYSIQITDANGCSQILFASINQPPALSIGLNGNTTICEGQSTAITSTVSGGTAPYAFMWSPIGGSTPVLNTSPSINTSFTVTVTDNNGCQTAANVAIIVNPKPNASLVNNKVYGCAPICASFSLSQSQGTGYSYNWSFTNNATGSITASPLYNPELCFNTPGTYNASLLITTPAGCTTSINYNTLINVYTKPNADFSASPDKPSILEPTVSFTNLSTGATNYAWYNINEAFSNQTNVTYAFQDPGKFLITLIASNGQCSDTMSKVIIIEDEFLFYIPNTFTPNNDNLNDFFYPVMSGYKDDNYNFSVFDRWGAQIFHTTDPRSKGWDGFYKGEFCKDDAYVWKVNVTTNKGINKAFTGHVTLLK